MLTRFKPRLRQFRPKAFVAPRITPTFRAFTTSQPQLMDAPKATSNNKAIPNPVLQSTASPMDNSGTFFDLQKLIEQIETTSAHSAKTKIIKEFLVTFQGDIYLLYRLLLCVQEKRVYRIREKTFAAALSEIFRCSEKAMLTDLEKGDLAATVKKFFIESGMAQSQSTLTLQEVDSWLEVLSTLTKEDEQRRHLSTVIQRSTPDDLYYLTKIVDRDLKVNIGAAYALTALHPDAYKQWKLTTDLKVVIEKAIQLRDNPTQMSLTADLMIPIKPMLARASKSLQDTWARCPNGVFAEIKYDGERIQIHKKGNEFKTFSRALKPVTPHKVAGVSEHISKAFKGADTLILDAELLLRDSNTGKPLPFGTLGIHKQAGYGADATLCLYIFDIMQMNGKNLMKMPFIERRALLEQQVTEVPGHVCLTEVFQPKTVEELQGIFDQIVKSNLEGLIIKDYQGVYEPNVRNWIKIKKEHFQGMGDSADLTVLGAYFGTGNKGGKMSVFLMGVYDPITDQYKAVTKVANGFSDEELDAIQVQLKEQVEKIERDPARCPAWLICKSSVLPDFVVTDPKKAPIWEIGGGEFVSSTTFPAGISIRFPRITRVRDDKDWKTATNLKELEDLFKIGGINRAGTQDQEALIVADQEEEALIAPEQEQKAFIIPEQKQKAFIIPEQDLWDTPVQNQEGEALIVDDDELFRTPVQNQEVDDDELFRTPVQKQEVDDDELFR